MDRPTYWGYLMEELPFKKWPKIHRFNREIIVTEKIDGTNGIIFIEHLEDFHVLPQEIPDTAILVTILKDSYVIHAGSRKRWLTEKADNYGFFKWVKENRQDLIKLGPGYHYGEWWGSGIQRGYGCKKGEKHFYLFNTSKWGNQEERPSCCGCVPVLYQGPLDQARINASLLDLQQNGSSIKPFMNPEGIVVFHTAGNLCFKITLENDEKPKGEK